MHFYIVQVGLFNVNQIILSHVFKVIALCCPLLMYDHICRTLDMVLQHYLGKRGFLSLLQILQELSS